MVGGAILLSINSCTTEDLEPTLAQSKSVEGSITKVDNLYGLLKGAMSSLSAGSYYGTSLIATNECRSELLVDILPNQILNIIEMQDTGGLKPMEL